MTEVPVLYREELGAYNHLTLPVWLFSFEKLQILFANEAAQAWLGYDAPTLHAMTIADLRQEADRPLILDEVRRFDGLTSDAGTWTIVANSGDHFSASFKWKKVAFEGEEAVIASIRDVTEIARAEAQAENLNEENRALEQKALLSAEHLSTLVDSLPGKFLVLMTCSPEMS